MEIRSWDTWRTLAEKDLKAVGGTALEFRLVVALAAAAFALPGLAFTPGLARA